MAEPLLPYDRWIDGALRGVIRRAITHVADNGLPGDHHFYVTFHTTAENAVVSNLLLAQHPEQLTIVLQHQFRDLEVDDDGFWVTLKFGGRPEKIYVPFDSVIAFVDPAVNFGLQFKFVNAKGDESEADGEPAANGEGESAEPAVPGTGEVITLDTFRKK